MKFPTPQGPVCDKPGETIFTFETPAGKARLRYRLVDEMFKAGAMPYLVEHIMTGDDDFEVVKWILEHIEIEPTCGQFEAAEALVGDDGFTIGMLCRVPFQRLLLDFMGEERACYQMADNPRGFQFLLDLLTEHGREILEIGLASPALLLQSGDNFEGSVTSPALFQQYCMPFLQEKADRIHARGRFLGSHMDGNLKPLLHLVPECGVDVVESFSPAPLTRLAFEEAWEAWRGKVLIWGGIPSPIFESPVPESEFRDWVAGMLDTIGDDGRIILGISDQAMGSTLIDRVRYVSDALGR